MTLPSNLAFGKMWPSGKIQAFAKAHNITKQPGVW
jgi:hypothetical protein